MNTTIEFVAAFNPHNSPMPIISARVQVCLEGYDAYSFKGWGRIAYDDATRFVRLLERGYSPERAHWLALQSMPSKAAFERIFEPSIHDKLTDERPEIELVCEETDSDEITTDWLTDAYAREFGLACGEDALIEDVAHFYMMEYADDFPPPHYLAGVLQLADEQDYTHSHHLDFISY